MLCAARSVPSIARCTWGGRRARREVHQVRAMATKARQSAARGRHAVCGLWLFEMSHEAFVDCGCDCGYAGAVWRCGRATGERRAGLLFVQVAARHIRATSLSCVAVGLLLLVCCGWAWCGRSWCVQEGWPHCCAVSSIRPIERDLLCACVADVCARCSRRRVCVVCRSPRSYSGGV